MEDYYCFKSINMTLCMTSFMLHDKQITRQYELNSEKKDHLVTNVRKIKAILN